MLTEIARLIDEHGDHLAEIETLDTGKAIREPSWIDIPFGADQFRYMAGAVRTEEGRAVMIDQTTLSLVLREPIGVVGLIALEFSLMATWKLAPALAAGNTVVISVVGYVPEPRELTSSWSRSSGGSSSGSGTGFHVGIPAFLTKHPNNFLTVSTRSV
jgi:acyl-CoA reductase-like NAD-dependent aldehyde dehydrogenase